MDADLLLRQAVGAVYAITKFTAFKRKANIIRLNKNNSIFLSMLRYLLGEPKVRITEEDLSKHYFYSVEPEHISDWETLMLYYSLNEDKTEEDIIMMQLFIKYLPSDIRSDIKNILCHKIPIGMDWTTYNKAMEE